MWKYRTVSLYRIRYISGAKKICNSVNCANSIKNLRVQKAYNVTAVLNLHICNNNNRIKQLLIDVKYYVKYYDCKILWLAAWTLRSKWDYSLSHLPSSGRCDSVTKCHLYWCMLMVQDDWWLNFDDTMFNLRNHRGTTWSWGIKYKRSLEISSCWGWARAGKV